MKYDDKVFYRTRDKFINKITGFIEKELKSRYKELKNTNEFSKEYFMISGAIGSLMLLEDKISLEKHKTDYYG